MDLPSNALVSAALAGLAAALACGLGVLPLFIRGIDPARHRGLGYAVAGGLMFSASVYNLILPGMGMDPATDGWSLGTVSPVILGILLGAAFLALTAKLIHHDQAHDDLHSGGEAIDYLPAANLPVRAKGWGGTVGLLVFIAMTIHSIPEGVAVGVAYTADAAEKSATGQMGPTMALAIALHNIPEGLAVAIPLRSAGVSIGRCFLAAVITSLPQPIAAVPAVLLAWFFQPLMPLLMGFAAGAMIFLVVLELIPEALESESPGKTAWAFTIGFCAMLLVQVLL
ncbi:MAG: ZIP family metal transporter [Planctomycetota bacterium]